MDSSGNSPVSLKGSPRLYTKIIKVAISPHGEQNIHISAYIDDFIVFGPTFLRCRESTFATTELLENPGFVVNYEKSVLVPSTPGVENGLLHYRALESRKKEAFFRNKFNFEENMTLTSGALEDFQWWIYNVRHEFTQLVRVDPQLILSTDNSCFA